jgi:hypothetical protein
MHAATKTALTRTMRSPVRDDGPIEANQSDSHLALQCLQAARRASGRDIFSAIIRPHPALEPARRPLRTTSISEVSPIPVDGIAIDRMAGKVETGACSPAGAGFACNPEIRRRPEPRSRHKIKGIHAFSAPAAPAVASTTKTRANAPLPR